MVRVIQISDTHIVPAPGLLSGRIDSAGLLEDAVARIRDEMPRIGPVDALIMTGDLSDDGSAESYARFRNLAAPLDLPLFVIPGNHDRRAALRAAFADHPYLPATGRLNWTQRIGQMHLIGLDTLVEGQGGGSLTPDTLDFLARALRMVGSGPVLLALHHPPFAIGIRFMDAIGLAGATALAEIVATSAADIRIISGHVHCMVVGAVGPVTALTGPATCSTFAADFRADAPVGFMTTPGGYMIHDWHGAFRSIHVGAASGAGPFAF